MCSPTSTGEHGRTARLDVSLILISPPRTCHISHKAVDPPGEAKVSSPSRQVQARADTPSLQADFEIFVDYAKRMGFKNKDGGDLLPFTTQEEAFNHWARSTKGRPCDYTGMSYAKLTGGSGIQWPCNEEYPNGRPRLVSDAAGDTEVELICDSMTMGNSLRNPKKRKALGTTWSSVSTETSCPAELTPPPPSAGTPISPADYAKMNPNGRAILKGCQYRAALDDVCEEYPFSLATGRNHLHFHTRTKTGRSKRLRHADHDPYVQIHEEDAQKLDIQASRRYCRFRLC